MQSTETVDGKENNDCHDAESKSITIPAQVVDTSEINAKLDAILRLLGGADADNGK